MQASPQLYLHCGWPKTGTKSLQAALARNRELLAEVGIVYPDRWGRELVPGLEDGSHNGLIEALEEFPASEAPFEEVGDFLSSHAGGVVLISCEVFTTWLLHSPNPEALRGFFDAVREVMPVTCVWSLRRLDHFAGSLQLQLLSMGYRLADPRVVVASGRMENLLGGMRQVEECADRTVYVEYEPGGGHNGELLCAFGISPEVREVVAREVEDGPRLNPSLSHKQAIALLHADVLTERAGVALERRTLCALFNEGDFEFENDGPAAFLDAQAAKSIREEALGRARDHGLASYVRFFGRDEVSEESGPGSLGTAPDLLSDGDLDRLVRACSALRRPDERRVPG